MIRVRTLLGTGICEGLSVKYIKSPKVAPTESRVLLAEEYLDEYPDIDLIQKDPVEYSLFEGVIERKWGQVANLDRMNGFGPDAAVG